MGLGEHTISLCGCTDVYYIIHSSHSRLGHASYMHPHCISQTHIHTHIRTYSYTHTHTYYTHTHTHTQSVVTVSIWLQDWKSSSWPLTASHYHCHRQQQVGLPAEKEFKRSTCPEVTMAGVFSSTTKLMLKNVIRHTNSHNKVSKSVVHH